MPVKCVGQLWVYLRRYLVSIEDGGRVPQRLCISGLLSFS